MADETDDLEAVLGVQFQGVEQALKYAEALRSVARAEKRVADATKARHQAQAEGGGAGILPSIQQALEAMHGGGGSGGGQRVAAAAGPNARLASIQAEIAKIRPGVTSPDVVEDLFHRRKQAEKAVERMRSGPTSAMEQALRTTRFGAGPLAPLAGRTADALIGQAASKAVFGTLAKFAGPIGIALTALEAVKMVGEAMYDVAKASAEASNALTSIRAESGGSTFDAARLKGMGFLGASAQGAAAFKDRISSDPQAMMEASRLGIRQLKGNFGPQNWAAQYLKAIEETSKISDEAERTYRARTLGISSEVARYSLLSDATKARISQAAGVTASINDPAAQKAAAEFSAAVDLEKQARENMMTAIGQFYGEDLAAFFRVVGLAENQVAMGIKANSVAIKAVIPALLSLIPGGTALSGVIGGLSVAGSGARLADASGGGGSALTQNTRATIALSDRMDALNGTIQGAGQRGGAVLGGIRDAGGAGYHEAITSRSLAFGSLG